MKNSIMKHDVALSVILPVRNEVHAIGGLLQEIVAVFEKSLPLPGEIIVIDDASDDGSVEIVEAVVKEVASRTGPGGAAAPIIMSHIIMPEPCGQSQALITGLMTARGDVIVTMDADGQYDPADIRLLLGKMSELDMVCGIRKSRQDTDARRVCSRLGNAFRNMMTADSTTDAGCTFRLMRTSCVPALTPFQGRLLGVEFFFHPFILRRKGFRVGEIAVSHRPRSEGKSNYKLVRGRAFRGFLACMRARHLLLRL